MARAANNISINFLIALACTNQNEFIKNQSRKRSKQGLETSISKGIEVRLLSNVKAQNGIWCVSNQI